MTLKQDVAAIRDQLTPLQGARVTDPHLADSVETDQSAEAPSIASPTAGPHRYTILVPHNDLSVVNIGTGIDNASRIKDTGITGRTKSHIHWHTTEGDGRSMIAIGGPTLEGWAGFKPVLAAMHGYTMQTEGASYNDSKMQYYVVSRLGEVVVRAHTENVRVQADAKSVEIGANVDVAIGAKAVVNIVADSSATLNDNGYKQHFDKTYSEALGSKSQKIAMNILDLLATGQGLFTSFTSLNTIGDNFKSGWVSDPNSVMKFAVDLAKAASTIGRFVNGLHAPGQAKVTGENYASLTGGLAASMFGNLSASITSLVSASVLGGTASLKGIAWTSVWAGLGVSVKTLAGKAEIKSEYGKAGVAAKQDVSIASKAKMVKITGKTGAQLNSDGPLVMHGSTAYCVGGADPGFGMAASSSSVQIGKFNHPKQFDAPGFDAKHGMEISEKQFEVKHGESFIRIKDDEMELQTRAAWGWKIDSNGTFEADGSKLLFG